MRFSLLLLSGTAAVLASSADEPHFDCLVKNSNDLAEFADCGHQGSLAKCLQNLHSLAQDDLKACYIDAGCSPAEAYSESKDTLRRCQDLAQTGELKKRFKAAPLPTLVARADASSTAQDTQTGGVMTGTRCFTTGKKSTSSCDITTSGKHVKTNTCVPTTVTTSTCAPSLLCTVNSSNQDICMDLKPMDVGGIIVTLVFAGALVIGAAALTWACCKDRKQQKHLKAKAEAVALKRAATKKQNAAQRQPLIRNPSGGANPFQDQPRI
ncbi:hypothetical protein B0T10DRAFT_495816 [Thelonectria olida]|uniref:Uncharacterized protein n=1 Tax=Thelonectria olida TaxID=1576542 RepID=A0A9P8VYD9_9HYPO|nr:hypothetical protein B0T10DRAFT_495816 [Thelonectria olida]